MPVMQPPVLSSGAKSVPSAEAGVAAALLPTRGTAMARARKMIRLSLRMSVVSFDRVGCVVVVRTLDTVKYAAPLPPVVG
jgi:hypothetical protein